MAIADLDYRFKPRRSPDAYNQANQSKCPDMQLHVPLEKRKTHSELDMQDVIKQTFYGK